MQNTVHITNSQFQKSVQKLQINPQELALYYCFASFNRNGFVREFALKYLLVNISTQNISFILARLNDYVEEIRKIASAGLSEALKDEYRECLLQNLKYIYHFKDQQHDTSRHAYSQIMSFLFSEQDILKHVGSANDQSRYLIANILMNENYDRTKLAQWFIQDKFFIIRKQALLFSDILPREDILGLLNDPSSNVRKQAVYWLAESGTVEEQKNYYREKLLDISKTVRQLAQFYLRQQQFDLVNFYINQFNSGNVEIALLALLELNQPILLEQAKPYLYGTNLKLKRASFLYVSHFTKSDLYDWALGQLADDISKFQVALLKYLEDFLNDEIESRLIEVLHNAKLDITKKRILNVLVQSKSLTSLEICLEYSLGVDIPNPALKFLIMQRLHAFKSGVYIDAQNLQDTLDIIARYLQQNQFHDKYEDLTFINFLKKL
ncbi:MAG: hypothetical protein ACRCXK_12405 [Wohlfahrtiimonas sp.]